ncbi:unnamed protein product [Brachionus calyciflorus]|uniref:Uncharacterized protein n=1 Tax=Brachionus calyciflorus TaxID=104777 RepID=A0A813M987_9BILA|nr:unnamed protein product [Brachionus calyciflorus]
MKASESINVLLGLGFSWLIASIVLAIKGEDFNIESQYLGIQIALFLIINVICHVLMILRRKLHIFGNAEFGGTDYPRLISSLLLIVLWIFYVLVISLLSFEYLIINIG